MIWIDYFITLELIEKCNELPGKPLKQILDELEHFCDMLEKYEKEVFD